MAGTGAYSELKKEEDSGLVASGGDLPLSPNTSYQQTLLEDLDEDITGQREVFIPSLGLKVWGTQTDLDENAYGAASVALIKDITLLHHQWQTGVPWAGISLTVVRLNIALGIMAANLIFQGLILWYIWLFVVMPSVRNVQSLYANFRAENFDQNGNLSADAWEEYEGKGEVCQITMSSRPFYFGILILWALLMLDELRKAQRVTMDILAIKPVTKLTDQLCYAKDEGYEHGGSCLVVGLTPCMRWSVIFFVCVPRLLIGLALLFMGCQWLSSAASFSDMTLNAMALEFVKNIDEILYESILPPQLKQAIADTNVFKIEARKTKKDLDSAEWKGYRRTLAWIAFMVGSLGTYAFVVQTVLPFNLTELNTLCAAQRQEAQTPICSHWTWQGGSESCYPYGRRYFAGGVGHHHGKPMTTDHSAMHHHAGRHR
mmetsp:Transcript_16914/g.43784  ORF Transcript_16914/g.43784 Transcript_16914/m.43784 type:complete len:430 (+) Transcript_16914:90-1379(+)